MILHSRTPTPLQLDLLAAAFLRHQGAVGAWERWRNAVDWDCHFDPVTFSLLPIIRLNLHKLGARDPLMSRLKGVSRQAWLANQLWIKKIKEAVEVCSRKNIEILLLPPTRRLLLDSSAVMDRGNPIHVALRARQAEQAIRSLLRCGWSSAEIRLPHGALAGFTAGTHYLALRRDDGLCMTLNWGLKWLFPERKGSAWDRALRAGLGGLDVRGLGAADALEYELRQPLAEDPFGQIASVLMVATEPSLDWPRLASAFRNHPIRSDWRTALAFVRPILDQWGECADPAGWGDHEPDQSNTQPGSLLARGRIGWRYYRAALGDHCALNAALRQLPGYLVGRWHLTGTSKIPLGFLNWVMRR